MTADLPLVSIVIPSFNQGRFIEQTLTSILGQPYPNLEVIVLDAGSKDETVSILKRYESKLAYWVSEPDGGQAAAINKGFRRAKGDILAWLNSDDMYMPCILEKVVAALGPVDQPSLVYGACIHIREGEAGTLGLMPPAFDRERLTYYDDYIQPSTFWTRKLWTMAGELDESLYFTLDWEWYIRASRICAFKPIAEHLSIYRLHQAHKSSSGGEKRARELLRIVERYASKEWIDAYRDLVGGRGRKMQAQRTALAKLRLARLRWLASPRMYATHGYDRVEAVLGMI